MSVSPPSPMTPPGQSAMASMKAPPPTTTAVPPKKTSGFAESFWTPDYAGGLGQLFAKLNQGVVESHQVLAIARMRADAEDAYGQKLAEITPTVERPQGFARDDGASVRKAYEGIKVEMIEAGKAHRKIAANIRELVVNPFGRWCSQHEGRVNGSHDELQSRLKTYERQFETVKKLKGHYFNKCRLLEDAKEESQLGFQDPLESPQQATGQNSIPEIKELEADDDELYELGDVAYDKEQVKKILQHMMTMIRMTNVKYPILGTYQNVSTGADITEYIQKHLGASTVSYAERIGQSMLDIGLLRLVGQVGKTFANSSRINFKWQSKAFDMAGIMEQGRNNQGLLRSLTVRSNDNLDSPIGAVGDYLSNWNPLNNQHPNESPADKLRREAKEADQRYKVAVRKLDDLRCTLEEQMIDHLRWQEKLELERLSAVKTVILDFTGAISNVIPGMQSTIDSMMIFQESIQPAADLRYMIESYRSGAYAPKVTTYENYTRQTEDQVFGIDVEARAKADGRKVPLIVSTILQHMDEAYPQLEGDTARQAVWKIDVPLAATHHLRNVLNARPISTAILSKYELPIVASVLKLYLLESESLIPSSYYDIIKAIYATESAQTEDAQRRVSILQSTLSQLKLVRIATLDAICSHFERFLDLTSADEAYTIALANGLASCVLRPRVYTNLTFEDKHPYRLVRDLLAHRHAIFSELKRLASQTHNAAGSPIAQLGGFKNDLGSRVRADSSNDESGRKAAVEARNRAISLNAHKKELNNAAAGVVGPSGLTSSSSSVASTISAQNSDRTISIPGVAQGFSTPRSRASSPLPAGLSVRIGNGHRRERSVGASESRFPVIASPNSPPITSSTSSKSNMDSAIASAAGGSSSQMPTPSIGVLAPSPVEEEPRSMQQQQPFERGRSGAPAPVDPPRPLESDTSDALQRRMGGRVAGSKVGEIGRRFDSLPQNSQKPAGVDGAVKGHSRGVTLEDKPWIDE